MSKKGQRTKSSVGFMASAVQLDQQLSLTIFNLVQGNKLLKTIAGVSSLHV